jgi:hypothetical protein
MVMGLEDIFPGLRTTAYQVTSPKDSIYNCIAWAAGAMLGNELLHSGPVKRMETKTQR